MTPTLSIIIISWNSLPMLKSCLHSLSRTLTRQEIELVWVDNGSSDGAFDWMTANYPNATIIRLDHNHGVAYARNRGVENAKGEYILFLDDDTEASSRAIDAMTDYLHAHPNAGICGTALRDADGNLQDSFKPFPGLDVKVKNVVRAMLHIRRKVTQPRHVIEVDYLIGACQMIRRKVFDTIGLLDENIFYGPEDADFCLRASQKGWKVVYLPNVNITHHWRRATTTNPFSSLGRKHIAALHYFYRKHHRHF
ncbi:MAG: glycosyltransferase family 2 protein [Prevotella sp.]|nr:glycosyltransferase family 2 protein [Bacteroides sp.]MCM1366504.1 glycosyltransferase family 2 protein [Prevotella sp.]MCM1436843.1 glycosyltransferase family 2 protein [Prevotella sp.]